MPLSGQENDAIIGTQRIDKETYRLKVTGLVERELNLSYDQLQELPAYSELVYMPCVEGWGFYAKWTGFRVTDLLNRSGLRLGTSYILFSSADGYSTSLPIDYHRQNNILLAYGINDLTLPPDRGYPLQLVAKDKYGYKWAKWITMIGVMDRDVRGLLGAERLQQRRQCGPVSIWDLREPLSGHPEASIESNPRG